MNFKLFALFCVVSSVYGFSVSDKRSPSNFIAGGEDAPAGLAPYQCSIQRNKQYLCACTIISDEFVLTTAVCVRYFISDYENVEIMVGSNDLTSGTYYSVDGVFHHEEYSGNAEYDLGVIRIDGKIAFNDKVKSIEVAKEEVPEGTKLQLAGWGLTDYEDHEMQKTLKVVEMKAATAEACKKEMDWLYHPSVMCTMSSKGKGPCIGDDGSPLVADNKLVGVRSYLGTPCARGYPDLFVNAVYLRDWIERFTN